ncbi:MAG: hypothetical protein F6K39_04490 [Okeania sp. SIO3B3]|nr:hypothetical protein [Okeania sp. SIO3B3]
MENIEYSGHWWLPSEPEQTIAGTLTFTNAEGIKLRLIGSFLMLKKTLNVPIILGIVNQKIITLCGCYSSISIPGFSSEEYWAELALIGRHFSNPDELLFNKARVQYSYLSDWADLPAIKREPDFIDWNKDKELKFTYTRPEDIEANTTYGKFSVVYGCSEAGKFESIDFKQFASLIIQPNEELSFKDFYSKFIHPLNNFLTFATDRKNSITELEFYSRHGDIGIVDNRHILDEIPIKAIYKNYYPDRDKSDRLLLQNEMFSEMLFSLADIKSDFSSTMKRWFDSLEKLDSIFNLFFSIRYKPDMYLDNKFINLVQAVESYHRRRIQKDKKKQTLQERLEGLLELIPEVTNQLINDKESFSTKIVRTRNDFIHDNEIKNEKSAKPEELPWLTELLSFILQACFLTELGFTPERCHQLLNKNKRYQEVVAKARHQKNNKAEN